MEEADKDADEAREPPVLSENEKEDGVSTESKEDVSEVKVESNMPAGEEEEEEDKDGQKRMINLQRDLTTLVSNIQTTADAEVVQQRTQQEEAQRIREEWLENALKSSQETTEELTKAWSILNQKVTDQDLRKTLNSQQQLCNSIIQDKYTLINDLQQELKRANKRHVKSLSKNAKEIDLMRERMEDQVKMMTTAYREELDQTERIHQQEMKILLTKDMTEWEEDMKEFWDKELERLMGRRKKVEECEEKIRQVKIETIRKNKAMPKVTKKSKVHKGKHKQHIDIMAQAKQTKQKEVTQQLSAKLAKSKSRMVSLENELRKQKEIYTRGQKNFSKHGSKLSEEYRRHIQKYERLRKQIKHFAVADAKTYENMWQMIDEELKELAERALTIDSVICKKHLGIAWEWPQMPFLEHTSPIQPQKLAVKLSQPQSQTKKCSPSTLNASSGLSLDSGSDSPDAQVYKELTTVQSESTPGCEEGTLFSKKQMEVLKLLCDEADFLIEPKVLKALASQQKEERTDVKLHLLCDILGINDKDTPKLADFLLEYQQQHRDHPEVTSAESSGMAEAAETSSAANSTSDLIHPDYILPALQSFLEQHKRFREGSDQHLSSFGHKQSWITSKDLSQWASLSNIISEDKLKLWDALERTLKQYYAVLTEISDLVPETEHLRQKNKDLRMKLEQRRKGYYP